MDNIIASLGYVGGAIEEMESHMAFLSEEDQNAFREVIAMAIPDHGHFYGGDRDRLVDRVLKILSDDDVVAGLDFSKLTDLQKKKISELFWNERHLYRTQKQAIDRMKEILGR